MYDSLLYGYGLTLSIFNQIERLVSNNICSKYINPETLLEEMVYSPFHKRINREFLNTFNKDIDKFINAHQEVVEYIKMNLQRIKEFGFERWVTSVIWYKEDESVLKIAKPWLYAFYNYWYDLVKRKLLNNSEVEKKLEKISSVIYESVSSNFITTNFDTILDNWLNPEHLHGMFVLPFNSFKELISFSFNNEESFEYKYLFGGNGVEKGIRLKRIYDRKAYNYDCNFLFAPTENYNLGHLLIYGVSFGRSFIMSDEFLETYPEHGSNFFIKSVDGHILLRLVVLFENNCIDKITVAYYSENDYNYYKEIFKDKPFEKIINYKKSNEVFNFQ